jgi:serine/threonine protein kinase
MHERLGRYSVVRPLGKGGMGAVYEGFDEGLRRRVALKVLHEPGDAEARERLLREARAAAAVTHPHVCQIYEIGEEGEDLFLALEFLEGQPLDGALREGPLARTRAVDVCLQVLNALGALHQRGLIHRDLKPSNLFLTPHGAKLLDFGLARQSAMVDRTEEMSLTRPGAAVGTPFYMAPEQWRGETLDVAADVYAAGVVLYEMLTGAPPFTGRTIIEVYEAVIHRHAPALTGGEGVLALDRVIQRALAKRAEDRYASASAMAEALRAAGKGVVADADIPVRPVKRIVALPFRVLRPDPETDFLAFSLPDAAASSLSGQSSLVVRSTHTAMAYAGIALDPRALARELEVDAVLSGTLLRDRDRVRIHAQVMEVPAGTVLWSQQLEGALENLFALEDSLAGSLAASLVGTLAPAGDNRETREIPGASPAYRTYLQANEIRVSGVRPVELSEARDLYRACVDADPGFAPAWARLGRIHRIIAKYGFGDGEENRRQARHAFRRALELEPDLPIAHNYYTYFQLEEEGSAEAAMVRLLERARTHGADPDLFSGLVAALRFCGLLEASLAAHDRARSLDPGMRTSVHHTHHLLGDWERAAETDCDEPFFVRMVCREHLGDVDMVDALRRAGERLEGVEGIVARGATAAIEGRGADVERFLGAMETIGLVDPEAAAMTALVAARAGRVDIVLRLLRRSVERGYVALEPLLKDPWFDGVRDHAGLAELRELANGKARASRAAFRLARGDVLLGVEVPVRS